MYQLDNEKFGKFLCELRKEKSLTQKQLAEKLFVSDKTVSKWERGASIPNVVLLIPIAEVLGVTVTELLKGERIDTKKDMDAGEVEHLVVSSLDLSVRDMLKRRKRIWIVSYLICLLIVLAEFILLTLSSMTSELLRDSLITSGVMLIFAAWLCFFAKELPAYYDGNKINFVSQGIFRIHMAGLSFNNANWIHVLNVFRVVSLGVAILTPAFCYACFLMGGKALWIELRTYAVWITVFMTLAITYYVGKKYE